MGIPGVTRGYKRLQGVTGGYKGLQGVTGGYKGLQGVKKGYKGLHLFFFLLARCLVLEDTKEDEGKGEAWCYLSCPVHLWKRIDIDNNTGVNFNLSAQFSWSLHNTILEPESSGGGLRIWKGWGCSSSRLGGVNFGFWSILGCSGQNAIVFSRESLVQGCTRKNINIYIWYVYF